MKTKTVKNIYLKFFNINVILFLLFSFTLFIELSKNIFHLDIIDSTLSLSLSNLQQKKIWVLLTYGFYHNNWFHFLLCFIPLVYLTLKLNAWYSKFELGRFYIFAYTTGLFSHIVLAPSDYIIYGSFGQVLAFLLLYTRLYGKKNFIKLKNFSFNLNFLIIIFIILDFLTIGMNFRYHKGSFASHLGIYIFFIIYIYIDKEKNSSFYTYENNAETPSSNAKHFYHEENNTEPSEHEIDLILDKISQRGIHSITEDERKKLKTASKRKS